MKFPPLRYVPDKHRFLAFLARGRRVLHVGCADALADVEHKAARGRFLHGRLAEEAKELWGCDIDEKALRALGSTYGFENLVTADAQAMDVSAFRGTRFDLIIAAEVIEHLPNPGGLLQGCRELLAPDGRLCITTPNGALSIKTFLHSLRGIEQVATGHVVLFSFTSLTDLMPMFGFSELRWFSALERHETPRNKAANKVLEGFVSRFPQYADSIICLASPEPG